MLLSLVLNTRLKVGNQKLVPSFGFGYLRHRKAHKKITLPLTLYVGWLISFASTVIFLFALDISG